MSFDVIEAHLLRHPGNNPQGKFYFAALVHDTAADKYLTVLNWGAGRGLSGTAYCYGDSGQAQIAGPFNTLSPARAVYNKKVVAKKDGGYTGGTVECRHFGIPVQDALLSYQSGGAPTPVSAPPTPQPVNTATLLAKALTPDTIAEMVHHRAALAERARTLRNEIAGIEAEAEALTLRLRFQ